ncbi:hypothetical protein ACNQFN_11350 [Thauera butanivorans]|uniref:hypothetical protein n=1 Tax=Thauera butanivorans TaxID=86174 RepID=UPI003AB3A05F
MEDKYQFLRQSLPELVSEAARDGGINRRAQLIITLLEECDQLANAARLNERRSKAFKDLPLCSSALTAEERIRLDENLKSLLSFLGSPGDWGYDTQLGRLTILLDGLRRDIWTSDVQPETVEVA